MFSQHAMLIPTSHDQIEPVKLHVTKVSTASQTGEVEISWPANITEMDAEFTMECFKKG